MTSAGIYHTLATSKDPLPRFLRRFRREVLSFSLPAPWILTKPLFLGFRASRNLYHYLYRILVCELLFKAQCKEFGKGVRTGVYIPHIEGPGSFYSGDNVVIVGKLSVHFAARFSKNPVLRIGNNTMIGHNSILTIGKEITIGDNCLLAGDSILFDSPGHPLDPDARLAGEPPPPEAVKPIRIGNNVWIGMRSLIGPGVTIGDGAVVAAGSTVLSDVAPNTLVAGNPARRSSYQDLRQSR